MYSHLLWFLFFRLTESLTVYRVQLLYTGEEKGGNPDRKTYPLPNNLRNLYRNLKSANFQDYAQTPQRKMNVHEFGFRSPLAVSATTHFFKSRSDENF